MGSRLKFKTAHYKHQATEIKGGALSVRNLLLTICFSLLVFLSACHSRDALLTQAQAAWDKEDWAMTVARYEEYLKDSSPSDQVAEVHFKVANVYYLNLKQYERAAEHYIRLLEDYPKFKDLEQVHQRLAECYVAMKKLREAISEYENLLKAYPETPVRRKIRLEIANQYYENDKSQALVEYQKVVKDAPYDNLSEKAYLRIGGVRVIRNEFEEAIPAYKIVTENTTDLNIRRQTRDHLADCYENTSNYEEAIKVLEQTEPDAQAPDYLKHRIASIRERQKTRKLVSPDDLSRPKR